MSEPEAAEPTADLDGPWKEALGRYFEASLALLFPQVHAGIDWSRDYEFLDTELQQIVRDAELGKRLADRLVKVFRNNGSEAWVLVHVEVQGQPDAAFPKRMYVYNYRIFDAHNREVCSLGVLGDTRRNWRPHRFGYDIWDCRPSIEFPVVKLLDFESRWEELEQSDNPFAFVVMAHLQAVRTRRKPQSRLEWKLRIARGLLNRGHSREDVLHLVRYIDWIMTLPTQLEERFKTTLEEEAQEKKMSFMTVWERHGHEEGLRKGIHQEGVAAVLEVLEERFGTQSARLRRDLERIEDARRLRRLLRRAVTVETLTAFEEDLGIAG
ncbi:MAG: transposase [Actinomycetota bacterium]